MRKRVRKGLELLPATLMAAVLVISACERVQAHSASDAYLTLSDDGTVVEGRRVIHGQWDVALRDLDFVLKLDDDGDGRLTWGEVRRHQGAIQRYAFEHLIVGDGSGERCTIKPVRGLVDAHADGAYMALFFDAICAAVPQKLSLHYDLFFAIDPSHRAIVVLHNRSLTATAVLSPQNPRIDLPR